MTTKLKEVDVVIVGLGWTGGILAKELTEAGMKVVALERGAARSSENDYSLPNIRDELRYVVRHELMQNASRDTLTVRNNPSQEALPMRRLRAVLPGGRAGSARSCRAKASAARACIGAATLGAGPTWNSRCARSTSSATAGISFLPT